MYLVVSLSPYLIKLDKLDIIPVLLLFSGKVTMQLKCGGKVIDRFVQKSLLLTEWMNDQKHLKFNLVILKMSAELLKVVFLGAVRLGLL